MLCRSAINCDALTFVPGGVDCCLIVIGIVSLHVYSIRIGDIVGADIVLLNGEVSADQSALTGESAMKNMKRHDTLHAGSVIKRGEANGIVVATGRWQRKQNRQAGSPFACMLT